VPEVHCGVRYTCHLLSSGLELSWFVFVGICVFALGLWCKEGMRIGCDFAVVVLFLLYVDRMLRLVSCHFTVMLYTYILSNLIACYVL